MILLSEACFPLERATYAYDNNGNTLSETAGTNATGYTWDFENRLTEVTLGAPPKLRLGGCFDVSMEN